MSADFEITVGEGRTRIPVRNLWLLYLWASDLYKYLDETERLRAESDPEHLGDLAARILVAEVSNRLVRQLSPGYVEQRAALSSVRGRIDHLTTARGGLLTRGQVACVFEELTADTARNRYVMIALQTAGRRSERPLRRDCLSLAAQMERLGVRQIQLDPATPRREVFGHFDQEDRRMLAAARLVIESTMLTQETGTDVARRLAHDHHTLRDLFEKAIRSFLARNMPDCKVRSEQLRWASPAAGLDQLFPVMKTDISIDRRDGSRLVIDTKFTTATHEAQHADGQRLRSGHLYQLYAYLGTQEDGSDTAAAANGLLLYPSTEAAPDVDVETTVQGHTIRVATIDLRADPDSIRDRLLDLASG